MPLNHEVADTGGVKAVARALRFAPGTEKLYRAQRVEQGHKHLAVAWVFAGMLAVSYIVSDYLSAPQFIYFCLCTRFCIMLPTCLLVAALIWNKSRAYEFLSTIPPIVVCCAGCVLIYVVRGEIRQHYLLSIILIGVAIGRPLMVYGLPSLVVQFLVFLLLVENADFIPGAVRPFYILLAITGVVASCITIYVVETADRRSFLLGHRVEQLNKELRAQSLTDPLTKLANRRSFEQAAVHYWDDASVQDEPVSIVLIDVDHFKLFNDTFGHSAGDVCLARIAGCVATEVLADGRLAVRFGGEELLLFLPRTGFAEAREVAERARLAIERQAIPHRLEGRDSVVSASFGVATATVASCTAAELIISADAALYRAKSNGRNIVWPPSTADDGAAADAKAAA